MKTSNKYLALATVAMALTSMDAWGMDGYSFNDIDKLENDDAQLTELAMYCDQQSIPSSMLNDEFRKEINESDGRAVEYKYSVVSNFTRKWCEALGKNTHLKSLSITFGSRMDNEIWEAFINALEKNTSITKLSLEGALPAWNRLGYVIGYGKNQHIQILNLKCFEDNFDLAKMIMDGRIQNGITSPLTISLNGPVMQRNDASKFADLVAKSGVMLECEILNEDFEELSKIAADSGIKIGVLEGKSYSSYSKVIQMSK